MEIKEYTKFDQVDVAVDLGVLPPPLPPLIKLKDFGANPPQPPPLLIDGILHKGCKMIIGATSKSNKSWALLDLGLSVAGGVDWWGHRTHMAKVAFLNFELQPWAISQRIHSLCGNKPYAESIGENFMLCNLRGRACDLATIRPEIERIMAETDIGLIIVDPAYKVLGDRDENANGEITDLMNQFESLAQKTGAAIVFAHHFAKGDSTTKNAIDRMSGAGAWARDPDAILILTPHEEEDCFSCTSILRNLPRLPDFVLRWNFPLLTKDTNLDPEALKTPQSKSKKGTTEERHQFLKEYASQNECRKLADFYPAFMKNFGCKRSVAADVLSEAVRISVITYNQGRYE